MKQEFEITEQELQAIYDISKNQTPVMFIGVWTGLDSIQEKANKLWQTMADKYGFVWDSVEPSAKGDRFFLAIPKPIISPKTRTEVEMDKYDTLQKIVEQLEPAFSGESKNISSDFEMNVAFMSLRRMANK